jgi:hypothetical protein
LWLLLAFKTEIRRKREKVTRDWKELHNEELRVISLRGGGEIDEACSTHERDKKVFNVLIGNFEDK